MADTDGKPVWFELTTPDQDAAQDFYAATIGWTIAPSPFAEHGGYRIAAASDGEAVAGLMTPPPGMAGMPGWALYLSHADVDAAARQVGVLGGNAVLGPMDIPHVGRFVVVTDPQGVAFSLLTASGDTEAAAFRPGGDTPGHGVWIELATPDPDAAFAFYGALLGWRKAGALPMPGGGEYAFIEGAGTRPGAMMPSAATGAPPRWNMYFEVPDIDAALATVTARGGTVLHDPLPIPGGAFSANVADVHGAPVGLVGPRIAGDGA